MDHNSFSVLIVAPDNAPLLDVPGFSMRVLQHLQAFSSCMVDCRQITAHLHSKRSYASDPEPNTRRDTFYLFFLFDLKKGFKCYLSLQSKQVSSMLVTFPN